jgi:hypothetical protein
MQWLRVLGVLSCVGSIALGCAKGRDAKSASKDDKLAYDEKGQGKKCDTPKSNCDEVKDPSLDFKEKCREAGFRIKQCGCENLCSGNINADRTGYTNKNELKTCKDSADKCETQETSAAYQDACEAVGGEMLECGCEWLCSKKLKEAIPDAPKEDEKKADEAAGDETKKPEEKKPAAGNMEGKSADEIAKDKAAKDKAAKDQAAKEKAAAKDQAAKEKAAAKDSKKSSSKSSSSSSSSSGGSDKKEKSRFFNDE